MQRDHDSSPPAKANGSDMGASEKFVGSRVSGEHTVQLYQYTVQKCHASNSILKHTM